MSNKYKKQSGFAHLLLIMVIAAVILVVGLIGSNVINKSNALGTAKEKAVGRWCGGHYLFTHVKYTSAYNLSVLKEIRASLTDGGKMNVQYRWIQYRDMNYPPKYLNTKSVTEGYTYWRPYAEIYIYSDKEPYSYVRIQARCGNSTTWTSDLLRLN